MIIKKIMEDKKISQSKVARDLEISEAMVTLILQGKRNISIKLIKKIRDKYNLSFNKILEE